MKKFTIILFTFIMLLTGCTSAVRHNYLILIDNSSSVPMAVINRYLGSIEKTILTKLGDKDKVTVQFIDGCSQLKSERIFNLDMAEKDFSNIRDGINHAADSAKVRRERYLNGEIKKEILAAIGAKRIERSDCGGYTDIINATAEVAKLVENTSNSQTTFGQIINNAKGEENYIYETCLVLFSDMINENQTRTYDFSSFGKIKEDKVITKVNDLKASEKLPDLSKVKVFVFGATSSAHAKAFAG